MNKRTTVAAMITQGLTSNLGTFDIALSNKHKIATTAVELADILIKEVERTEPKKPEEDLLPFEK